MKTTDTMVCGRCKGTGFVTYSANVDSNRCWKCDATGRVLTKAGKAAKEAAAAALRVPVAEVQVGDVIRHADGGMKFFVVATISTRRNGTLEFNNGELYVVPSGFVQREAR